MAEAEAEAVAEAEAEAAADARPPKNTKKYENKNVYALSKSRERGFIVSNETYLMVSKHNRNQGICTCMVN